MIITPTTTVIPITATTHFPIKLITSNFPVWKCQVPSALIGLGLEAYVDGTVKVPELFTDEAKTQVTPCYTTWFRQDRTILSALLGSCSDTIQPIISSATSARHALEKLTLFISLFLAPKSSTPCDELGRGKIIFLRKNMVSCWRSHFTTSQLPSLVNCYL
ncbi:unnamed protein product [Cuscuta epithymum]|uniref:Retrotransposon Copia-like N-terminal domain-containing protein n=1 Tax=Cuscuta epithymum TaxID=186058 RepID=A0AAV0EGC2_9ASTE|nr:unnamed protein product [Cuscuta epithymum]